MLTDCGTGAITDLVAAIVGPQPVPDAPRRARRDAAAGARRSPRALQVGLASSYRFVRTGGPHGDPELPAARLGDPAERAAVERALVASR